MEKNDNKGNRKVKVEVLPHGPLRITGKFVLRDLKRNNDESPDEVLLCRCGRSKNKPYCDCSHEI